MSKDKSISYEDVIKNEKIILSFLGLILYSTKNPEFMLKSFIYVSEYRNRTEISCLYQK